MDLDGEYRNAAIRGVAWEGPHVETVLKTCIPSCEEIERTSDTTLSAKVAQKIDPLKARVDSTIELTDIIAPESHTIQGEGKGGGAGFATGSVKVTLEEEGAETVLHFAANAQVSRKPAHIGSRLIDATAKKVARQIFDNFHKHLHPEEGEAATA